MADALVGAVVHIYEERLPVGTHAAVVYSKTMVLRGDEATVSAHLTHRLVVTAVTIFQLLNCGTGSLGKQLIAHADAANGFVAIERLANVFDSRRSKIGVTRAI